MPGSCQWLRGDVCDYVLHRTVQKVDISRFDVVMLDEIKKAGILVEKEEEEEEDEGTDDDEWADTDEDVDMEDAQ
jgi:hypothetical protein